MKSKKIKFLGQHNHFRLMLTLGLAVLLPAAALIYANYHQLKSIKRNKVLEAAFHRDFQYMLTISEKTLNQKAHTMTEEAKSQFPSPDADTDEAKEKKLDLILAKSPWLSHAFLFDKENGMIFRSQPQQMSDEKFRWEHDYLAHSYKGWFGVEGKSLMEEIHKKTRPIMYYGGPSKRADGAFMMSAFFPLPITDDRMVLGGISFDPYYLKKTLFPETLKELIAKKKSEERGNPLAMMVYSVDNEGRMVSKVAVSEGWGEGKAEISRNMENAFRGAALGIKLQGTSVEAIGQRWAMQSFLILGALSLLMIGGLTLAYRSVSKEVALAHLKSDFVSNVSHELRTPLALIRLYAETLELGRITTPEKKEEYYRIIRKESERLTSLINNILDFSRIEAGHKEYDFRETDVAELVSSTLDAYRYQIEQQGFAFEQSIDPTIPAVRVDREAIARALVNLVNNALKYSANEKFLGVKLYRANDLLKLEVVDRGIGITRREQSKIFEKFYRTGDPLVHNTKGSGLGLSLVRHITRAHGGEVEVESTPGKGSKFILSLPLATATH